MANHLILTIARQYGSGGREIGEKVASLLGIPLYDRELITMSAKDSGLSVDALENVDEKAANSLLYTLAMGSGSYGIPGGFGYRMPINDQLFVLQSDTIRRLAKEGPCVIVGRAADYVVRDNPGRLSVFLYADIADRKARVTERHQLSEAKALDLINKTDRRRSNYYNYYTGGKWGKLDQYHIALNTSCLGIDGTAELIAEMAKKKGGL